MGLPAGIIPFSKSKHLANEKHKTQHSDELAASILLKFGPSSTKTE
jgi:hypothetical protein